MWYKGYFHGEESGYYYCKSRYYVPNIGRWLTPDKVKYLDNSVICGYNPFIYCKNNPIIYVDEDGNIAVSSLIIGAIIGAAIGFGVAAYCDYNDDGHVFNGSVNVGQYIGTTLLGGITGALSGAALSSSSFLLSGIAGGASGSFLNASFTQISYRSINLGAFYTETIAGGLMGALGSMNLSLGVALAKMIVSGVSTTLIYSMYGYDFDESIVHGLESFAYSGVASIVIHVGSALPWIEKSHSIVSRYESAFIVRYLSWIINNI